MGGGGGIFIIFQKCQHIRGAYLEREEQFVLLEQAPAREPVHSVRVVLVQVRDALLQLCRAQMLLI